MRNSFLQVLRSRTWLAKRTYYTTTQHIFNHLQAPSSSSFLRFFLQFPIYPITPYSSSTAFRFINTQFSNESDNSVEEIEEEGNGEHPHKDKRFDEESAEEWEEEDETEPEIGDGGDGGGIVFGDISWGQRALDIANEVLPPFSDDFKIFSFKNTPRGYIYVRIDKLSDKYGCPSMEEIEQYSSVYKKRLEEVGESGEIPGDLALEVSSPGAERILRVPDDLGRFKDMPMRVRYVECPLSQQEDGVFFLESVENESEQCVWKLADVKENRDPLAKGRPLSRKRKDWRLTVPFESVKRSNLRLKVDRTSNSPGRNSNLELIYLLRREC